MGVKCAVSAFYSDAIFHLCSPQAAFIRASADCCQDRRRSTYERAELRQRPRAALTTPLITAPAIDLLTHRWQPLFWLAQTQQPPHYALCFPHAHTTLPP